MAEAIINIGANTQEANAQIDQLNQNLGKTGAAANTATVSNEKLEAQLKKQEATIKTIDGAVNLLGGSVELAASAAIGLGLATEEGAKEFEAAALGAIAFADGAKRTVDGVKSLNEGLASYGGIAGLARKAQLALNTAILANPYIAAAAALAVLVAGIAFFVTSSNDAEKAQKDLNKEIAKGAAADADYADLQVRLAKARGEDAIAIKKQEIASRELRIEEKIAALNVEEDGKKRIALQNELKKLGQDQKVARVELTTLETQATEKAAEDRAKDLADRKAKQTAANKLKTDQAEKDKEAAAKKAEDDEALAAKELENLNKANADKLKAEQDLVDKVNDLLQSEEEKRILSVAKTYDDLIEQARNFGLDTTALEAARETAIQGVIDTAAAERQTKRDETNAKELADQQAIADALLDVRLQLLDGIGASLGALANLLGEGTAAFKAAALAEIAISTATGFINALDIAQKSAKATGPAAAFAFPIFYASQIAAVLGAISSAKNVLATVPGGGANISTQKPSGGGAPSFGGGGAFTGALPGTGGTPPVTGQQQPIRAYVIAQDVSTSQEANAAINRRRRLGPG